MTSAEEMGPSVVLNAVESYRGTITDLDTARVLTGDSFAASREALGAALRKRGLASGDRVLLAISNGPLFVGALASILAAEGCPLLVHSKTPGGELLRYARRFGTRFLATDSLATDSLGEHSPVSMAKLDASIEFADHWVLHLWRFDEIDVACTGPVLRGIPLHPTSGSTGLPKVALRPAHAAMEEARHYAETMEVDEHDTVIAVPPMTHAYGYGVCVMLPLLTGANIVTTRRLTANSVVRSIEEHRATILPVVPATLDTLIMSGKSVDFRRLRHILSAGAMLTRRSAERFLEKTSVIPCPLYGTTETGGIAVGIPGDISAVDGRIGPPMNGVEVKACPAPQMLGLGLGKLAVRTTSMMRGYLHDDGLVTFPGSDGWYETGDLAVISPDGAINLRGRDSEVLNVFGLKVVPCEVEDALLQLDGVFEVKVYGG